MKGVRRSDGQTVMGVAVAVLLLSACPPDRLSAQSHQQVADVLRPLVEAYGVSGHEGPVREVVQRLLPAWARPEVDSAGNLLVRAGRGGPLTIFIAHVDEIGFTVTGIRDDGQLTLRPIGGFMPSLFEAQPALVHTAVGIVPAVLTPRDSVGPAPRRTPSAVVAGRAELQVRVDPGTGTRAATEALGIRVGDAVTMPKRYVPLANARATARSFDDRVGVAAALLALRRLDPQRLRHEVLFVFSVREETGLTGARVVAAATAAERPARVYALDTFVSSDGPRDPQTTALARLGDGAVARAVDNSSVTPPAVLDTLVALARTRRIPLQVGTTNGGNDGSVFTRWGVVNVPIGWPLRYAHGPAEVIDLRDVVALADLTLVIAERW